jgi:hypothetical protein
MEMIGMKKNHKWVLVKVEDGERTVFEHLDSKQAAEKMMEIYRNDQSSEYVVEPLRFEHMSWGERAETLLNELESHKERCDNYVYDGRTVDRSFRLDEDRWNFVIDLIRGGDRSEG